MIELAKILGEFQSVLIANIGKPVGLQIIGAFARLVEAITKEAEK